jgi:hypothetical protein
MKWTRLWFKIIHKIDVEQTKGNVDLAQESFYKSLHMPTIQETFLNLKKEYKWIKNELKKNYK